MDLSNDLISKFVKITNDDKNKNSESTVYGTVVEYNGGMYVRIDGSDLLTPVETTADFKPNERVTVMIKNHSATVTGNITSPSTNEGAVIEKVTEAVEDVEGKVITEVEILIADRVSTGQLDAEVARIDELIAGKASVEDLTATNAEITNLKADKASVEDLTATNAEITNLKAKDAEIENLVAGKATVEDLTATNAEITNLKAKDAEIENLVADKARIEDLTATNARIDSLQANKADITYLDANFATIDELEAAHADIEILDAEVANINTLVNGNLTSDNILSLNITSQNTTMENAFVKDAMIDTVTANKIMSGTIDTNNVTIQSTDGSMLLQGTLLQMKDDNGKVRIQIGKDTGGNFTFILYDESGTGVLIDEEGIKSSDAIADGLIVDAKVADNANIAGSKLDIASVITEVNNDNSTTIKSNKIYLDEQGQSLEVAFNSLKTHVDTIQDVTIDGDLTVVKEQVQSNTTQIAANKEGISTLVSENTIRKEEIQNLDGEIESVNNTLSSKYSSLEQDVSGFKTTVADTYATKQSVTDVSNNLANNYSTTSAMNSAIQQKANEITSSVSQTYTTKSEFDNLEIGGTNLARQSNIKYGYLAVSDGSERNTSSSPNSNKDYFGMDYMPVRAGDIFTITSYNSSSSISGYIAVIVYNTSKVFVVSNVIENILNSTTPVSKTFTIANDGYIRYTARGLGELNVKLEKGNKATDWSPAPEDIQGQIDATNNNLQNNYSTTSQMNSAIQQKANEITSSVSETYATKQSVTDVSNNLSANYSTTSAMNSAIQQKANEITSTVSQTYATKSEFNNLQIGGTNLIQNGNFKGAIAGSTSMPSPWTFWGNDIHIYGSHGASGYNHVGCVYIGCNLTDGSRAGIYSNRVHVSKVEKGANYMASFILTMEGNVKVATAQLEYLNDARDQILHLQVLATARVTNNVVNGLHEHQYHIPFTMWTGDFSYVQITFKHGGTNAPSNGYLMIVGNVQIEKGNKATDWSPAPEDVQGQIDATNNNLANNYSTTSQMNSAIQQKANEITSSVSQTYATKQSVTDVSNNLSANYSTTSAMNSAIQQKANEITSSVSQTYATKQSVTDVSNNLTNNYSTTSSMNSAINQKANEITSSVSETYTTKSEFNALNSKIETTNNKVATIETNLNGITQRVSSTESTTSTLTTKVNTAQTTADNASNKIDTLKIGARNYVLNSGLTKNSSSFNLSSGVSRDTNKKTPNGNNSIYFNVSGLTTDNWRAGTQTRGNVLEVGKTYTIGANVLVPSSHGIDRGASLEIICWNSSDARTGTFTVGINTSTVDKWQSLSRTFTVPANTTKYTLHVYVVRNGKLYAGDYSLVEGDKSIWSIAPEDVQSQIDTAQSTADSATTKADNAQATANTANSTANTANAQATTNKNNISSLTTTVSNTNSKVSSLETNLNSITSRVSATETTLTNTTSKIDNLQVGGRNLIKQSVVAGRSVASASYDKNTATWTITADAGAGGTWGAGLVINGNSVRIPYGKTYVLSFEIKVPRACSWNVDVNNYAVTGSSWSGNDNDNGSARATSSKSLVANQWIKCWSRISNTDSRNTDKVDIYDNSCFGVVMENETSSMTFQIRNVQGEIGNIPSEYTPAPEDVQSQIDTATNTANTNKSNISSLTTRVSNAETKLTKNSLTTTIGSHYTTSTDVNGIVTSKGYATTSQVQQTVDSLSAKFSSSGGYNLLRNSGFIQNGLGWGVQSYNSPTNGSIGYLSYTDVWGFPSSNVKTCQIKLSNQSNKEYGIKQSINTTIGKKYTVSFYYAAHRISQSNMIIRNGTNGTWHTSKGFNPSTYEGGAQNVSKWGLFTHTFTASESLHILDIVINNAEDDGYLWIAQPMVEEGEVYTAYSPHPSEVYSGITQIDKDGIKVYHNNANGYTHMTPDGFFINRNGADVLYATSNGLYVKGNITSGSTIQGARITGSTFNSSNDVFQVLEDGTIETSFLAVNGAVSTDKLNVNNIENASYPKVLSEATTVYISPNGGVNAEEFYDGAYFTSLSNMLAVAPRNLNGYTLTIRMAGDLYENVALSWFHSGQVNFEMQGYTLYGYFYGYGASMCYRLYGNTNANSSGAWGHIKPNTGRAMGSYSYAVQFQYCQFAVNNIAVYPSASSGSSSGGIGVHRGATGIVFSAKACGDMRYLVRSEYAGRVHVNSSQGACNNATFCASTGGIITLNSSNDQAGRTTTGNPYWVGTGGMIAADQLLGMDKIKFNNSSQSGSSSSSGSTTRKVTETIKATSADTYRSTVYNSWKGDGTVRQGDYGYGDCQGCWFFGNNLYNTMNAGTVTKVVIRMQRQSGGVNAAQTLTVKSHNHTSRPSGAPTYTNTIGTCSCVVGSYVDLVITDSATINKLKTCKGLGLSIGSSSSPYAVCSGACSVIITYTTNS